MNHSAATITPVSDLQHQTPDVAAVATVDAVAAVDAVAVVAAVGKTAAVVAAVAAVGAVAAAFWVHQVATRIIFLSDFRVFS